MANEFFKLALSNPEVLEAIAQDPNLDSKTRKYVEQMQREMSLIALRSKEGEDKNSLIYLYTMWKADQTLTAIETLKILRSPIAPAAELDALDQILRKRYLEQMNQIAQAASLKIVEKAK